MHKAVRVTIILSSFFILSAAGVLGGVAYAFHSKFYPGVWVAGISLSGLTYNQGKTVLDAKVKSYVQHSFKIVIPDPSHPIQNSPNQFADQEIATTAGDLGVTFDAKTALDASWAVGRTNNVGRWLQTVIPAYFEGNKQHVTYQVHPEVVKSFVFTQVVPRVGSPVAASVIVRDGVVGVSPPIPGFIVDEKTLQSELASSLSESTENDTTYLRAPVTQADSSITEGVVRPIADSLDRLGNTKVILTGSSATLQPTREQILSWFTPIEDQKGVVSLSIQKSNINNYLASSASKTVDPALSADNVVQSITPLLTAEPISTVARISVALVLKPVTTHTAEPGNYTLGKFDGKYIEVNLAEQKMYRINGTTLETTYLVSSGKASTPTPKGIFHIHGKSPRAYSYLYGLYMPWWENFLDGEYGIHELPVWPNGYREGEGHLGIPVSDGCVRLGIGDAKEMYDWTEDNTPVYIH